MMMSKVVRLACSRAWPTWRRSVELPSRVTIFLRPRIGCPAGHPCRRASHWGRSRARPGASRRLVAFAGITHHRGMNPGNHGADAHFKQRAHLLAAFAEEAFIGAGIAVLGLVGTPSLEDIRQIDHSSPRTPRLTRRGRRTMEVARNRMSNQPRDVVSFRHWRRTAQNRGSCDPMSGPRPER